MKTCIWLMLPLLLLTACLERNIPAAQPSGMMTVFDTELYYKVVGHGPPMVILHGGPGWSHDYLLPHLEPLAQNYQLIFYDQRFAGRSSLAGDSLSLRMEQLVEDLEFIREHFGLEEMNIMAHSWGGLLALRYARTYPERLNSLILVNSAAPTYRYARQADSVADSRRSEEDNILLRDWYRSDELRDGDPHALYYIYRLENISRFYYPHLLDSLQMYIPPDFPRRRSRMWPLRRELWRYDLLADWEELRVPTLLIHGEFDPTPVKAFDQLRAITPEVEWAVFPFCGHFSFIEAPEQFTRVVRQFMRKQR